MSTLLKAKYCPRVAQCLMDDQHHMFVCDLCLYIQQASTRYRHFVNPYQLVQAVSCTQKHVTLTFDR